MMNSMSCVNVSTMKPYCRFLIGFRSSCRFGYSPPKLTNSSRSQCRKIDSRGIIRSGVQCRRIVVDRNLFCDSDSISVGGGSRVLRGRGSRGKGRGRGVLVIPRVASDYRNHSSLGSHVNDKRLESIFVKPLVFKELEEIPKKESGSKDGNVGVRKEKEHVLSQSEAEKEAWKLLRDAVVNYCGFPVGTVAANDPGEKQTLNYDQVFIRDFVPSAYAFLLDGEGEIVRNFLLHTLQLQGSLADFVKTGNLSKFVY